jgi:hypothetical protein
MMNGVRATIGFEPGKVVADNHPPIVETRELAAGDDVYPEGELIALDADGKAIQYDPAAVDPQGGTNPAKKVHGVLVKDADTSETSPDCVLLVHGTVKAEFLTVKGVAANADAIAALKAISIFAI